MDRIITNDRNNNLKKRLQELIPNSKEVKILVGYFHFSGIKELYETLKKLYDEGKLSQGHIKILVGKYYTKDEFIQGFTDSIIKSIETTFINQELNNEGIYNKVNFFIRLLKEEIIIIKKTLKQNHSKIYLFKTKETSTPNIFISGSSNLSRSGLLSQQEFNTESDDNDRFKEAENLFDRSWENAIPLLENDIRRLEDAGLKAFETVNIQNFTNFTHSSTYHYFQKFL
jgi:HKD family nuclease